MEGHAPLRPGRDRFSINPMAMGSPTCRNTIGIVEVCRFAATDTLEPDVINSSAPRRNSSLTA